MNKSSKKKLARLWTPNKPALHYTLEEKYGDLFMTQDEQFPCPTCHCRSGAKVIAAGLPMKFCVNEQCSTLWGEPFAWIYTMFVTPFLFGGFHFMRYEGGYLRGLWQWLSFKHDHDCPHA